MPGHLVGSFRAAVIQLLFLVLSAPQRFNIVFASLPFLGGSNIP
jgi:hypothetical protein